ncbi:hypothetical protein AB0L26_17165 [Streptomyces nondiastaticus]|uniref:hypothetical protein n=1 Tax=Streptomyces nondiastaticus TaxID=3154512 RepID=UPI00341BE6A7
MLSRARTTLISGVGAAAVVLGAAAPGLAAGTDTALPTAVETFEYPGAAKILKERGIRLESGDGHILLTDCKAGNPDISVYTKQRDEINQGRICFKVTGNGKKGYLALEIPDVIAIAAGKYGTWASVGGPTGMVNVPANDIKAVGEPAWGEPATLLALQV